MAEISLKTNQSPSQEAAKQTNVSTNAGLGLADSKAVDRDSLREAVRNKSASTIEIVAGQGVTLDPHTLKQMFLMGKLTQAQLAHQLKNYNDVVADSVIKEGKHSQVQTIDYREVGRASIAKPGADFKPDAENKAQNSPPPKDAKTARKEANSTDDQGKKRELEKKEQNIKNEQSLKQVRILNNFNDAQIEQKNQHATREMKKREEQQTDQHLDLDKDTSLDKAMKRTAGRARISKNLAEEIKAELEKLRSGPGRSSTNNSK